MDMGGGLGAAAAAGMPANKSVAGAGAAAGNDAKRSGRGGGAAAGGGAMAGNAVGAAGAGVKAGTAGSEGAAAGAVVLCTSSNPSRSKGSAGLLAAGGGGGAATASGAAADLAGGGGIRGAAAPTDLPGGGGGGTSPGWAADAGVVLGPARSPSRSRVLLLADAEGAADVGVLLPGVPAWNEPEPGPVCCARLANVLANCGLILTSFSFLGTFLGSALGVSMNTPVGPVMGRSLGGSGSAPSCFSFSMRLRVASKGSSQSPPSPFVGVWSSLDAEELPCLLPELPTPE
mmetsp:Transcript_31014/g.68812  ORF Transcript_31014/g.68812 Transcript_31014/m.68812 type:complete len:288 (-) Transcript_31014:837-1700(-)